MRNSGSGGYKQLLGLSELGFCESLAEVLGSSGWGRVRADLGPRAMFTLPCGSPLPWLLSNRLSRPSWRDPEESTAAQGSSPGETLPGSPEWA